MWWIAVDSGRIRYVQVRQVGRGKVLCIQMGSIQVDYVRVGQFWYCGLT